jgi:hypothetical protein
MTAVSVVSSRRLTPHARSGSAFDLTSKGLPGAGICLFPRALANRRHSGDADGECRDFPFEFNGLADTVRLYVKQVKKLADDAREELIERNRRIAEGVFRAIGVYSQDLSRRQESNRTKTLGRGEY